MTTTKETSSEKRTQDAADEAARLLADAVVNFTDQALDARLKPIVDGAKEAATQARKAAETAENASLDLAQVVPDWKLFIAGAEKHLGQIEINHSTLVEKTARGSLEAFRTELHPLLGTVNGVAAKMDETSRAIQDATNNFSAALEALRAGPPSLAAFLVEAKADLDKIRQPTEEFHANLEALALQVGRLEQTVETLSRRVVIGLIFTGLASAGVVGWLAFRFLMA
jgi:hypothetical protein